MVGDEIQLVGRVDDLLNLRGKKVHPAEIERVLGQLPGGWRTWWPSGFRHPSAPTPCCAW
jgi:acyl-CoA synthetase (AMP-forming)/AMP-acid ligase II